MNKLENMGLSSTAVDVITNDINFAVSQTRKREPTEFTAYVVTKDGSVVVCPRQDSNKEEWSAHVGSVIRQVAVDAVIFCGEALVNGKDAYSVKVETATRYVIGHAPMTRKSMGSFEWLEFDK